MSSSDASDLKGVRVLVVEDTWHVAKALKSWLERLEMFSDWPHIDHRRGAASDCGEQSASGTRRHKLKTPVGSHSHGRRELHAQGNTVTVLSGYAGAGGCERKRLSSLLYRNRLAGANWSRRYARLLLLLD